MTEPLVVEVERNGFVESAHLVDVVVVDERGSVVAAAGDGALLAAFRSSAKPIQARVCLEAGWEPPSEACLALACASHNGEPVHVETARQTLAAAGLGDDALRCPADVPFHVPSLLAVRERAPVYHNCSGKHAAFLATCAANGWPAETYRDPEHPLQRAIRARLGALLGEERLLVDGCGVPTFVAPLHAFARAFATIGGGREAAAMRAHPMLVGGSDRLDTDLMSVAPVVIKAGAEGLACVLAGNLSIALKSRDGAARPRGPATIHVLRELGVLSEEQAQALAQHGAVPVLGGGVPVGAARARGTLHRP